MKSKNRHYHVRRGNRTTKGFVAIVTAGALLWSCSGTNTTFDEDPNNNDPNDHIPDTSNKVSAGKPLEPYCCSIKDAINKVKDVATGGIDLVKKLGNGAYHGAKKAYNGVTYVWDTSRGWVTESFWTVVNTTGSWGATAWHEGTEYVSDGTQWLYGEAKDKFKAFLSKTQDAASFAYNYEINNAPGDLYGFVWNSSLRREIWKTGSNGFIYTSVSKWVERGGEWVLAHPEYATIVALGVIAPAIWTVAPTVSGGIAAGAFIYVGQNWFFREYGVQFPLFKKDDGGGSVPDEGNSDYNYYDPALDPDFNSGGGASLPAGQDLSGYASQITSGVTTCSDLGFDTGYTIYQSGDGTFNAYVGPACICTSGDINYADKYCIGCNCSASAIQQATIYIHHDSCNDECANGGGGGSVSGGVMEGGQTCGPGAQGFRYCRTGSGACGWQWCQGNAAGDFYGCATSPSVGESSCSAKGI